MTPTKRFIFLPLAAVGTLILMVWGMDRGADLMTSPSTLAVAGGLGLCLGTLSVGGWALCRIFIASLNLRSKE